MSVLPSALLDSLAAQPGLWPGDLADPDLRRELEQALDRLPEDVLGEIVSALGEPARNVWARTAIAAIRMARGLGSEPIRLAAPGCLLLQDPDGRPWALGILGFTVAEHLGGAPGDVGRLTEALDQTFSERQYVLYLRRAVPEGFDPAPIARAVHLWLGAIERGEWQGQHAIYEDKDIALELILTGGRAKDARNRVFTVGPITALERLAGVDAELVREALGYQESVGDVPMVCVLGADQPWRLPRGYVEQLLYGTANFVCATSDPPTYEAGFSPNGRSLFSDPACRNLVGLWWIEPDQGPLGFRAWAHDNPWSAQPERVPQVSTPRFAVVRKGEVGARGRQSVVLRWTPPAADEAADLDEAEAS